MKMRDNCYLDDFINGLNSQIKDSDSLDYN